MDKFIKTTVTFKLDNVPYSFELIHNLDIGKRTYSWNAIIENWSARCNGDYTAENLCAYINSKSHMTDCYAFTIQQYEEKFKP